MTHNSLNQMTQLINCFLLFHSSPIYLAPQVTDASPIHHLTQQHLLHTRPQGPPASPSSRETQSSRKFSSVSTSDPPHRSHLSSPPANLFLHFSFKVFVTCQAAKLQTAIDDVTKTQNFSLLLLCVDLKFYFLEAFPSLFLR